MSAKAEVSVTSAFFLEARSVEGSTRSSWLGILSATGVKSDSKCREFDQIVTSEDDRMLI